MRTLRHFLTTYKLFSLALIAAALGLILTASGYSTAAHLILSLVSLCSVVSVVISMWHDIRTGKYGIDILAITAIVTSVILGQYWAAIVIVIMFTGGEALEDYAEHRAKTELNALLARVPQHATIIRKGKTMTIPVREIRVRDTVIIKPGDIVPVDAHITQGAATFDESSLTGESLPQPKKTGDLILSGSVNTDSLIEAVCVHIAAESQYEQIITLVRRTAESQAPVVRLADRYSVPFTIVSYTIALTAWIVSRHAIRFLDVIVVATPCPLLLAAPIAIISGMSRAAKHGIIIKTGAALEQVARAKTIVFDKTGTLTAGIIRVDAVVAFRPYTKRDVLSYAASLEQHSNHILARAIVDQANRLKYKITKIKNLTEVTGQGLRGSASGKQILVGRLDFLAAHHVALPKTVSKTTLVQTTVYVSVDGVLAGFITLSDTVRPETKTTITQLQSLGFRHIFMFTGDALPTAKAIAKQAGIRLPNVKAHMLPADKLQAIEALTERPIIFVGDGVNDAPVLTAADVGIALGARGSTAASESADMVIMLDDLSRVGKTVTIAHRTFQIARQSILGGIALSIILMVIFATGIFRPLTGAILQEVVDVIVIFNALRTHNSGHQTTTSSQSA